MATDLSAIKAALTDISDTEVAALIAATNNKPRWSGTCVCAESVTAGGARSQVQQD
jgi:hypothetical protein